MDSSGQNYYLLTDATLLHKTTCQTGHPRHLSVREDVVEQEDLVRLRVGLLHGQGVERVVRLRPPGVVTDQGAPYHTGGDWLPKEVKEKIQLNRFPFFSVFPPCDVSFIFIGRYLC